MTRPKNPAAAEKKLDYQEAITAVKDNQFTCHAAALIFNVLCRTFVNEAKKPRNLAHERDQNLTHDEAKELL